MAAPGTREEEPKSFSVRYRESDCAAPSPPEPLAPPPEPPEPELPEPEPPESEPPPAVELSPPPPLGAASWRPCCSGSW